MFIYPSQEPNPKGSHILPTFSFPFIIVTNIIFFCFLILDFLLTTSGTKADNIPHLNWTSPWWGSTIASSETQQEARERNVRKWMKWSELENIFSQNLSISDAFIIPVSRALSKYTHLHSPFVHVPVSSFLPVNTTPGEKLLFFRARETRSGCPYVCFCGWSIVKRYKLLFSYTYRLCVCVAKRQVKIGIWFKYNHSFSGSMLLPKFSLPGLPTPANSFSGHSNLKSSQTQKSEYIRKRSNGVFFRTTANQHYYRLPPANKYNKDAHGAPSNRERGKKIDTKKMMTSTCLLLIMKVTQENEHDNSEQSEKKYRDKKFIFHFI